MMLGSDVSRLSTTTASATTQGLSIVVPLYNEAAGLAMLHERLTGLARTLKARYGLESEVVYVDGGGAAPRLSTARPLGAAALDTRVVSLPRISGRGPARGGGPAQARGGEILFREGAGHPPPS